MRTVCFYFQMHQPYRLLPLTVLDNRGEYFEHTLNREILQRVARKCYMPATALLLDLVRRHEGRFRVAFSMTGLVVEQLREHAPMVIEQLQALMQSGCCEILGETYYHSLASLYQLEEFDAQVAMHTGLMQELFEQTPTVFRNTELIYDNALASHIATTGRFRGMLAEGVDRLLAGRSPHQLFRAGQTSLPLLLRNYRLTDDIAFRFCDQSWSGWPLTADKFVHNLLHFDATASPLINLFMDLETFGEHQWRETGIFDFLTSLPEQLHRHDIATMTPSEAIDRFAATQVYDAPQATSWADREKDLSAWVSNAMQRSAVKELYTRHDRVLAAGDARLLGDWRRLTCSDHIYYMCTKYFSDGAVHKYFSPYESPYDSYAHFMNALENMDLRLERLRHEAAALRVGETIRG